MIRLAAAIAVGLAALVQDQAHAQDRAQQRADLLAAVVEASAAPPSVEALERVVARRSTLIEEFEDDALAGVWMLDQAGDLLAQLSITAADARLVVGLLPSWERDRALMLADRAVQWTDRAGEHIARRFASQQAILDAGGTITDEDRAVNRRLQEGEMLYRRPLLRARALLLLHAGGALPSRIEEAIQLLESVGPAGTPRRSLRDAWLVSALAASGTSEYTERAGALADALRAEFEDDADGLPVDDQVDPIALVEALLARARLDDTPAGVERIDGMLDDPPFARRSGLRRPMLVGLAIEASARLLAESGAHADAVDRLVDIERRRDIALPDATRTAMVDERLIALPASEASWAGLESDVVLRLARAMVARDRPELDDRAEALLDAHAARLDDADGPAPGAAAVHDLLARVLLANAARADDDAAAAGPRERAAALAIDLLDAPGDASAAVPSPELLAALAQLLLADADRFGLDRGRRLLRAAIDANGTHPAAPRWRLQLAAALLRGDRAPDAVARAIALAESAEATARDGDVRARAVALAGALHARRIARIDALPPEARLVAVLAAAGFADRHPGGGVDAPATQLVLARVYLERGRPRDADAALAALASLPPSIEAGVLAGMAYDQLGRGGEAFAAYRRAAAAMPEPAPGEPPHPRFWSTWLRLLQLLDAQRLAREADDPAAAERIRRTIGGHLLRLRSIDPQLGGGRHRSGFQALERRLGRDYGDG
ncbi:MAG: hypothetical protein AAFX79_07460 [Planctomycetota bacterium]